MTCFFLKKELVAIFTFCAVFGMLATWQHSWKTALPGPAAKPHTAKIYCRPDRVLFFCFHVSLVPSQKPYILNLQSVLISLITDRMHISVSHYYESYLPLKMEKKRCDQSGKEWNCQRSEQEGECDPVMKLHCNHRMKCPNQSGSEKTQGRKHLSNTLELRTVGK